MMNSTVPWLLAWILFASCSTTTIDLAPWRLEYAQPRPAEIRGDLETDLHHVDVMRARGDLVDARALALALAAENVDDPRVLFSASRAESDGMLLFPGDKDARNHAAASSLEYAERASEAGADGPQFLGQFAWALGTTTHLQPMGDRSDHAHRTLKVAERALTMKPGEPRALATTALVLLRLETLPWIARVMARGRPASSLEAAEGFARRAVEAEGSRENRIILAKVLLAAGHDDKALGVLEHALATVAVYPRDRALEPEVRSMLEDMN